MAAFNKTGGFVTLAVAEALEEALCHGWMDGQIKYINERSYKKYFARRLPRSKWSSKNMELPDQEFLSSGLFLITVQL